MCVPDSSYCSITGWKAIRSAPISPLDLFQGFIGFGDSLLDDLTLIFLNLIPEQKPSFRKSIARLLMKVLPAMTFLWKRKQSES